MVSLLEQFYQSETDHIQGIVSSILKISKSFERNEDRKRKEVLKKGTRGEETL